MLDLAVELSGAERPRDGGWARRGARREVWGEEADRAAGSSTAPPGGPPGREGEGRWGARRGRAAPGCGLVPWKKKEEREAERRKEKEWGEM